VSEDTENSTLVDNGWMKNVAPETNTKKRRKFWKKRDEFTNVIETPGEVKVKHSGKIYNYLDNVFHVIKTILII